MNARIIYPDDEKDWLKITSAKIISTQNQKLSKVNSMNILKITSIVTVSLIGTLALAAMMGFQFPEIIAQEIHAPKYLTAENVTITGDFKFREGEELVPIQVFSQTKGFQRADPFIFTIQKVVGNTPLLHQSADQSFSYRNSEIQKQDNNPFDVDIILSTGPDTKRVFSYTHCYIKDYKVNTLRDNEEGYFNKGFATVEDIIIECNDYQPQSPSFDKMMTTPEDQKAHAKSSMDLKEPFPTWSDHFKYQKPPGSLKQ